MEKGEITVKLPEELLIRNVAVIWKNFVPVLGDPEIRTVIADLSDVAEIDTAGIQLLMALKKYSGDAGAEFRMQGHTLPVLRIMDLYGLTSWFRDKVKIPKEFRDQLKFRYGVKK